ncbi:MAG: hypothetical protein R2688_05510 [Fimbriimonadaceae bacterium]
MFALLASFVALTNSKITCISVDTPDQYGLLRYPSAMTSGKVYKEALIAFNNGNKGVAYSKAMEECKRQGLNPALLKIAVSSTQSQSDLQAIYVMIEPHLGRNSKQSIAARSTILMMADRIGVIGRNQGETFGKVSSHLIKKLDDYIEQANDSELLTAALLSCDIPYLDSNKQVVALQNWVQKNANSRRRLCLKMIGIHFLNVRAGFAADFRNGKVWAGDSPAPVILEPKPAKVINALVDDLKKNGN